MSEPQYKVEWLKAPEQFRGDIAATISIDGDHWRKAGAHFLSVNDEQTGPVDIAAGIVEFPGGAVQFGLLDYGAGMTYLLTPASGPAKEELASLALLALAEAGELSLDDVLDEQNPYETSLNERVAILEQWAGEAVAEAESTTVPVAVEVEVSGSYPAAAPEAGILRRMASGESLVTRHTGIVKDFDTHKGGFISPEGGGKEVFVHPTSVRNLNLIAAGATVLFRYAIEPRGGEAEAED